MSYENHFPKTDWGSLLKSAAVTVGATLIIYYLVVYPIMFLVLYTHIIDPEDKKLVKRRLLVYPPFYIWLLFEICAIYIIYVALTINK